ncbi:hypothetical protein SCHPADRAFT_860852 [Schizopora paradoxa]|uniref:PX domain-containing protein n=1 Tax=Schizopora paradoxa TaxID=27342 RepID=A0A0H2R6F8_9AGAM|nr:hypothetical protein SCHPADRAFT_860852 [Schizopora paradoxa]
MNDDDDDEQLSPPPSAMSTSSARPRRPTRPPPAIPQDADDHNDGQHSADALTSDPPVLQSNGIIQSPTSETDGHASSEKLTPLRAHYLKKTLIALQFGREFDGVMTASNNPNVSTLSYLGPPFTPPPRDAPRLDLPFLKFVFRQFVLTFPFLAAAPKDFFPEKVQPFIMSLLSRNLSVTSPFDKVEEESEQASQLKMVAKIEKNFAFLLSSITKIAEPEQVVRLTQADLNRLEAIAKRRQAKHKKAQDLFEVNVVCIRIVVDKGRMRSKTHDEFIIRTRRTGYEDVFVSRRYGDFKTLSDELRKRYPEEEVRAPPAKDKTVTTSTATFNGYAPRPSALSQGGSQESLPSIERQGTISGVRLAREKNRLTLRAYLHSLMLNPTISSSPVFRHFLLSDPTRLNPEETEDARRREEADRKREEGRIHFAKEIAARVEGLRSAMRSVKGDVMQKDGLSNIFDTVRRTEDVRDLPKEYRAVLEWGRISFASTIFQQFIASDEASERFAGLKRIHGLMPYFVLKGILRISNPVAMIRGALDLFAARPFGGQSLLQKMFTSSMQEEVKALGEDIEMVMEKVDDPVICEKIRQFVYAPSEIQAIYRADAAAENMNLMTVVLRSGEQPALSRAQIHRVMHAHQAHARYMAQRANLHDSDDDDGPEDEDAWLYEDLNILAKLYARLRDREQLIELIFESNTADLLKDIITIFYSPLAQVYKAASIADSLGDMQNFINDLIKTVEMTEEAGQDDPHRIVQTFINLVQRHEQAFYTFVHKVHSKGEGLFDSLMKWTELFINFVREGLGEQISLEFLLPHTGDERANVLKEVDAVAMYHYKLKLAHEDKLRRRFGHAEGGSSTKSGADAEDEAVKRLMEGVMSDLSVGDLVRGEAEDAAADMGSDSEEYSSEYETASEDEDSESGSEETESEETNEGASGSRNVRPGAAMRSLTTPSVSSPNGAAQRFPSSHSNHQRERDQRHGQPRGRSTTSDQHPQQHTLRPRSRTRSLQAIKNILRKNSSQAAPPVPPVPPMMASRPSTSSVVSPYDKPLPPSPMVDSRTSVESTRSQKQPRTPLPQLHPRKGKDKAAGLTPPELHHIPNVLPIFVEIMRPLLRPSSIN